MTKLMLFMAYNIEFNEAGQLRIKAGHEHFWAKDFDDAERFRVRRQWDRCKYIHAAGTTERDFNIPTYEIVPGQKI